MCVVDVRVCLRSSVGILEEAWDLTVDLCTALFLQSSALFFILSAGLQVWCSAFFDDFPTMSVAALSKSTDQCVGLLFDMLGIQFAKEGKKSQTFGPEMKALGFI